MIIYAICTIHLLIFNIFKEQSIYIYLIIYYLENGYSKQQ
jgi:hypothetical protein